MQIEAQQRKVGGLENSGVMFLFAVVSSQFKQLIQEESKSFHMIEANDTIKTN